MYRSSIPVVPVLLLGWAVMSATGQDAKKPSDADLARLLVGKWTADEKMDALRMKGSASYNKDGTFKGEIQLEIEVDGINESARFMVAGTWKVVDGVIETTVTESSEPQLSPVGATSKETVVAIDDTTLRTKTEKFKAITWKRVKN
jgi:hypothetical protein